MSYLRFDKTLMTNLEEAREKFFVQIDRERTIVPQLWIVILANTMVCWLFQSQRWMTTTMYCCLHLMKL